MIHLEEVHDPHALPALPVQIGLWLFCAATAFVILALTPLTYQLDDIKVPGLLTGGAVLLAYWAFLWAFEYVENPPKIVAFAYLAYLVVCLVSILTGRDFVKWVGWQFLTQYTALFGFVLLGSSVLQTRRMVEWMLKFWVTLTLVTTVFGLFHYAGGFEWLFKALYEGNPPSPITKTYQLIGTFQGSRSMISTILNTQFFGNFLVMLAPVAAVTTLVAYRNLRRKIAEGDPPISAAVSMAWLGASGLAVVLAITCVATTYAKSSMLLIPFIIIAFVVGLLVFLGVKLSDVRKIPHLPLIVCMGVIAAMTVGYYTWGDMVRQLRGMEENLGPRRIIFGGAWSLFLDHPIFGNGPGSFRLLFPEVRSPDYHMTRISNVTLFAHNWMLDHLSDTGFLGFAAYMTFLGGIFALAWKAMRRGQDSIVRMALFGVMLGILSILAGSLTTPMTRWPVGATSLHAMLGTLLGIAVFGARTPAEVRKACAESKSLEFSTQFYLRVSVAAIALVFAYNTYSRSKTFFAASRVHNIGLQMSEAATARLRFDELAKDPNLQRLYMASIDRFNESLSLDPTFITTYYKLAHSYNRIGMQDEALATYETLTKFAPHYSEVHYNLGVVYYNKAAKIRNDARKALSEGRPEDFSVLSGEAKALFEKSLTQLRSAAKQSNKITVHYILGMVLNHAAESEGVSDAAKALYREAGDVFANAAKLPISKVLQEAGQSEREAGERATCLRLAPESYASAGEFELAAEAFLKILDQQPSFHPATERAVANFEKAGKPERALELLDGTLLANPLDSRARIARAELLRRLGRAGEAVIEARTILEIAKSLGEGGSPYLTAPQRLAVEKLLAELAAKESEG